MRSRIAASGSSRIRVIAALLGALVIASVLWTGSSLRLFEGNTLNLFQSPAEPERIVAEATYGKRYDSVSELLEDSPLVVRGRIVRISDNYLEGDGVAFTNAVLRADVVLRGNYAAEGGDILVRQVGGFEPRIGKVVEMELQPLMRVGDEYLLFLHPVRRNELDRWVVTGGFSGRFKVENGKVYRPTPEDPLARARETLSRDWNGKSVAAIESAIRSIP